ncbi:MAG TPA: XrtB/PEP-CTERM-associated polysaccharide biosynthesis outer membrane protein EpsL [Methylophilaceae bacterium]
MSYVLVLFYSQCSGTVFAIENGIVDIRPYVSATAMYDDNIFRFSNESQAKAAFGTTAMGDTMTSLNAGVNVGIRLSRQQLNLGLGLSDNKFDRFKLLDYTGNNASAAWVWQFGNHVNGVLSYTQSESAPGFAEIRSTLKNLRTTTRELGKINWQFHPSWLAFASYEQSQYDNSSIDSRVLNSDSDAVELGVQYENAALSKVRVSLRDTTSNYPDRIGLQLQLFGDSNSQREIISTFGWSPTKLTKINATVSFVELDYPGHSNRNFTGLSQNWTLDYALTTHTDVLFSAFKEVSAVQDVLSTFVESTGFSIRPTWQATSKISLGGSALYQDRAYLGSSGVFAGTTEERRDQFRNLNMFLNYQMTRKLLLQTNYSAENRTSNVNVYNIKDNTLSATLRYDF